MRKFSVPFFAVASMALALTNHNAAAFNLGDLVVLQVGDGTQALASQGNTIFLDDYTTGGSFVSSVMVPDSGVNSLILSGTATSEGALSLSADGHSLTFGAYNTPRPTGTGGASVSSGTASRAIGSVNASGVVSLAASSSSAYQSAQNIRGAVTDGANNYWGAGGSGSGTYYFGNASTAGSVQTNLPNTRVVNIFNGNLYFSTGAGSARGIYSFSGLPTATATPTAIINTGSSGSPYDFAINISGNTGVAYVADDSSIASGGGIKKYTFNGTSWTLSYTLGTGTSSTVGARGLAVDFSGADPVIYATTAESANDRIIEIQDTGSGSTATTLATSANNEIFRGLDFAPSPVPEPSSLALLGGLGILALKFGRRK